MNHYYLSALIILLGTNIATAADTLGEVISTSDASSMTCPDGGIPTNESVDRAEANVDKTRCEVINEQNTCSATKKVDLDKRKIYLDSLQALDTSYQSSNGNLSFKKAPPVINEENRRVAHNLQTDIDAQIPGAYNALKTASSIRKTPTSSFVPLKSSFADYDSVSNGQKIEVYSNYHAYLKRSGNDKKFEKYQENFADDYINFESEKECQHGVSVGVTPSYASIPPQMEKEAGLTSCEENENVFKQKYARVKDSFNQYFQDEYAGENGIAKGSSCNSQIQIKRTAVYANITPSCAGSFEQLFEDNEWDMNTAAVSSDPEYNKFKECVDKMKADGFKLNKVYISASSSQLNNTGRAGQQFCAKGFLELSRARANSARNLMVSNFEFPSGSFNEPSVRGSNGNGSSGECPYKEVDGREVLKPEYARGGSARDELNDSKFVKVTVNYEPKTTAVNNQKFCYHAQLDCTRLTYRCNEWSPKSIDSSWGIRQSYIRRRAATQN